MAVYEYTYFASTNHTVGASQAYYTDAGLTNYAFTTLAGFNHDNDNLAPNKRAYFTISGGSVVRGNTYYHNWFPAGSHSLTVGEGELVSSYIDGLDDNTISDIGSYVYGDGSDCIYESTYGSGTYTPIKEGYSFNPASEDVVGGTAYIYDFNATENAEDPPEKPINPTPANADTGVDWSAKGLSWEDGGESETYNIYFGLNGDLSLISSAQADTSITVDDEDIPYPEEGESGAIFYWRVDATNEYGTTTGDTWYFDARPAKATVPSPADTVDGVALNLSTMTWTGGATASSYNLLVDVGDGLESQEDGLEEGSWTLSIVPLAYRTVYTWRIDSINVYGITTGDEWTFTTLSFSPPGMTYWDSAGGYYYRLLIDSDGDYGDHPADGGVENTDWEKLAGYLPNFINTNRRLIAAAENRIWYEDI